MEAGVQKGTIIFRNWDQKDGLNEVARNFRTLDELYTFCLQNDPTLLVDRIIIDGRDSEGAERSITLVFQSVTLA